MLREKFSEFLKNLLLLAVTPVGFLAFTGTTVWQLDKIPSGQSGSIFSIFASAVSWVIFMFVPYGLMLWRGKSKNDKTKILNGITGIWAVNFFYVGTFPFGIHLQRSLAFLQNGNFERSGFQKYEQPTKVFCLIENFWGIFL